MNAPTEQTEAQDDGLKLKTTRQQFEKLEDDVRATGSMLSPRWQAVRALMDDYKTLRAQLEAARGERDRERDNAIRKLDNAIRKLDILHKQIVQLRADLAQNMQEHQDALSEMRGRMEGAQKALRAVEFDCRGYCVACDGWNTSPNGSTRKAHTKDCPVAAALSPPSAGAA